MKNNDNIKKAAAFCEALRMFSDNPDSIDNLQSYLENHFDIWFIKYANTPDNLIFELSQFASIRG